MTRLHRLSEDSLVNRLVTVRHSFDDLKAVAHSMGSTSVQWQRVVTDDAVDFSVATTYHVIQGWEVTYTPDGEGVDGTGMLWKVFFNGFNPVGSGDQYTSSEFVSLVDRVWTYRFWAEGSSPSATLNYDVKVVVYATTQGTISVSQIQ